jgi:SAM-dependent methyltransferase
MKYLRPLRWVRAHVVALHDALGRIEGKLDRHRGALNSVEQQFQTSLEQAMLRIKKEIDRLSQEIRAELGFTENAIRQRGDAAAGRLDSLETEFQSLATETSSAHLTSQLAHLTSLSESRLLETTSLLTHLETALQSRLNTFEHVSLPALMKNVHQISAVQLGFLANQRDRSTWAARMEERYLRARPDRFESYLERAKQDYPAMFEFWFERLDRVRNAFDETKVGNAAHDGDLYSRLFRSFVEIHATGRLLDVGCGVFGLPYYLSSYPTSLVSGLEPLPLKQPVDFELVQGISEYLPWPESSFSTVVSATSLDHSISLERSLAEIRRVLAPGGKILLWIGSVPGASQFAPTEPDFKPADLFHLFHFDVSWFEPMLAERFHFLDRLEFETASFSHVFYALRPK